MRMCRARPAPSFDRNPISKEEYAMSLFNDPVGWAGSTVKTWTRFWLFSACFVAAGGFVVYQAATSGWFSAIGVAFYLAANQVMCMYAMRRMYLLLKERETGSA